MPKPGSQQAQQQRQKAQAESKAKELEQQKIQEEDTARKTAVLETFIDICTGFYSADPKKIRDDGDDDGNIESQSRTDNNNCNAATSSSADPKKISDDGDDDGNIKSQSRTDFFLSSRGPMQLARIFSHIQNEESKNEVYILYRGFSLPSNSDLASRFKNQKIGDYDIESKLLFNMNSSSPRSPPLSADELQHRRNQLSECLATNPTCIHSSSAYCWILEQYMSGSWQAFIEKLRALHNKKGEMKYKFDNPFVSTSLNPGKAFQYAAQEVYTCSGKNKGKTQSRQGFVDVIAVPVDEMDSLLPCFAVTEFLYTNLNIDVGKVASDEVTFPLAIPGKYLIAREFFKLEAKRTELTQNDVLCGIGEVVSKHLSMHKLSSRALPRVVEEQLKLHPGTSSSLSAKDAITLQKQSKDELVKLYSSVTEVVPDYFTLEEHTLDDGKKVYESKNPSAGIPLAESTHEDGYVELRIVAADVLRSIPKTCSVTNLAKKHRVQLYVEGFTFEDRAMFANLIHLCRSPNIERIVLTGDPDSRVYKNRKMAKIMRLWCSTATSFRSLEFARQSWFREERDRLAEEDDTFDDAWMDVIPKDNLLSPFTVTCKKQKIYSDNGKFVECEIDDCRDSPIFDCFRSGAQIDQQDELHEHYLVHPDPVLWSYFLDAVRLRKEEFRRRIVEDEAKKTEEEKRTEKEDKRKGYYQETFEEKVEHYLTDWLSMRSLFLEDLYCQNLAEKNGRKAWEEMEEESKETEEILLQLVYKAWHTDKNGRRSVLQRDQDFFVKYAFRRIEDFDVIFGSVPERSSKMAEQTESRQRMDIEESLHCLVQLGFRDRDYVDCSDDEEL